jgi:uncharacterized MnhB-related membrane protein
MTPEFVLDLMIGLALVVVAWAALHSSELFRGVIFYIVFGMLIALGWVRLGSPDIALAEAAIGAGLTGALLLDAVRQMGYGPTRVESTPLRVAAAVVGFCVTGMLVWAVLTLPHAPGGLTVDVLAAMDRSGVAHPVTAVLLNFRGYDTWLELGVLLIAMLSILALRRRWSLAGGSPPAAEPLLGAALSLLLAPALLVAIYLLALGAYGPGGAFQAGAVAGAMGVLWYLAGNRSVAALGGVSMRLLCMGGLLAFWVAAVGGMAAGGRMLQLPPGWAYAVLLVVEVTVTVSIAVILAALFVGARPLPDGRG